MPRLVFDKRVYAAAFYLINLLLLYNYSPLVENQMASKS